MCFLLAFACRHGVRDATPDAQGWGSSVDSVVTLNFFSAWRWLTQCSAFLLDFMGLFSLSSEAGDEGLLVDKQNESQGG